MKKINSFACRCLPVLFVTLFITAASVLAQTTAFTYQGRITDGANNAPTATYQMKFTLHSAVSGVNNQVGTEVINSAVTVTSGVFSIPLDFGAEFPGANRWLEINIKRTSDTEYTTLNPRHAITSVPYSVRALSASSADSVSNACVGCVLDSNINSISGSKITGTVANADNAATATTAATASSVSPTAGDSVIAAVNNAATTTTVSENRLPFTYFRVKPVSSQISSSTNSADAVFDVTGNLDDGNGSLSERSRFRFNYNGGFLASGVYDGGASEFGIPADGAGTRMMWYPGKASFRAGYVNGTQWDDANIGSYSTAFGENARASGDNGFAVGKSSTAAGISTTAIGEGNTATGAASVALGYGAHTNSRQGSFVFSDRSGTLIYFNGNVDSTNSNLFRATVNHSFNVRASGGYYLYTNTANTTGLRISQLSSNNSVFFGSFVYTDRSSDNGITPTVQNQTIFRSSGGFTIYSNSDATSGVSLAAGAGAWNSVSDRNMKENFSAVNPREILRGVLALPITTWNYKTQDASVRHIGAMAQDFKAAFNVGENDTTITTIDPDGVALAAIQGLNEEIKDRDAKIEAQQQQLDALSDKIKQQQTAIDALRAIVCQTNKQAEVCKEK